MTTNADVLLAAPDERIGAHAKWLGYIKAESARLAKLTDDLLALARMDPQDGRRIHAVLDLGEAVRGTVLAMDAVFHERGVALRREIAQLATLLLDNAQKYAGDRGAVDVRLERRHHAVALAVTNTGAGIAPERLPRIFDRFYRVDPSRTRGSGGYGLGLAIAKAIVDRHTGKISARSTPGGATTFTVELPLASLQRRASAPNDSNYYCFPLA
ncbi:MAG TPA: HAMP domain-containing sensor histidine kinase [Desulfobacterales bacterium]|nr:HAMP domain-containing sensor histidine kinase [Desulfobacterales bacterium]